MNTSVYSKMIEEIPKEILNLIPARVVSRYTVLPLAVEKGILKLLVPEDLSREAKDELKVALGQKLEFIFAPRQDIEESIKRLYGIGAGVIEMLMREEVPEEDTQETEIIDPHSGQDPTITALVNELFLDALKYRASDIHIEPFERWLRIRYRVDGLLQDARVSEQIRRLAPNLISRIKIMARLDIGEKRLPQDGRIKIRFKDAAQTHELDLRVSVIPSSFGEAIVIRILKPLTLLSLGELGFEEQGILQIRSFLRKPHGVILITGPTGSGKTTTLYSCLKELNETERKIITVEDPVEYKLPGVVQMQVSYKIDFTFAKALRAILRHDPDCIMIGEIRDFETAEIAIRAALTGHLVFSTLHTNDAPSAVTRLVEMGIEPYLVASALEGVMAQRLVRRFCADCAGKGCSHCRGLGFYGRLAVSEIMPMTEELRDLILERKTGSEIRRAAIRRGMRPLYEDGIAKSDKNLTSRNEIQRIICAS